MTPQDLIKAFDTLAEAPDGVKRLRELVLQLAVRGRLVPQDPVDAPASVLLARIKAEKTIAKKSRVRVDYEECAPFDRPASSWEWVYLGDATGLVNGKAFKPVDWSSSGLPIVRIQNLNNPHAPFNYCNFDVDAKFYINSGDLLLSWSGTPGTSFGAFIWSGGRAVLNQHIFRCTPRGDAWDVAYLRLAINSRLGTMIERAHGGVGLRHVTRGKLDGLWLALPPLAEQKRIVARVDELMGLLDRLEAARNAREATRTALRDAALAALADADTPEEVEVAWERIAGRMDDLFTDPADVAPLRQTVLQLAVRGRLVPQDPEDEPAGVLLERIAAEKARLVKEKKIRRRKSQPPVEQDEVFPVPSGWSWCRLEELLYAVADGPHFSPKYVSKEVGVPFLSTRNISLSGFRLAAMKYVSKTDHAQFCKRVRVAPGDVLYTKGGTTGIALANTLDFEFSVWVHVAVLKIPPGRLSPEFLAAALNAPHCYKQSQTLTHGTGNRDLGLTRMVKITVPLAPLREQRRIVAKVDEFMQLLDRLEQHLARKTTAHDGFAAAAVHHLDT